MYSLFILSAFSCILCVVLTPLTRDCPVRPGMLDRPDSGGRIDRAALPPVGGGPILALCLAAILLLSALPLNEGAINHANLDVIWRLFPAVGLLFVSGPLNDWLSVQPWQRIAGQLAAAVGVYAMNVPISGISMFITLILLAIFALPFTTANTPLCRAGCDRPGPSWHPQSTGAAMPRTGGIAAFGSCT